MASRRKDIKYGKYRIIAAPIRDIWKAAAYVGKAQVAVIEGPSADAAIEGLKSHLNERARAQFAARRGGVPTSEEYREAFECITKEISPSQLAMLRAHYHAKAEDGLEHTRDRTLGTEELARAGGYPNHSTVNLQYGKLGRRLAEYLGYHPPVSELRGEAVWTFTLATGEKFGGIGLWTWTMRPEVAEALRELNMV